MNCFEWQNRASDYLDGTLIGPLKREADAHLDSCPDCSRRHERFRRLTDSIAHQPRSQLPIVLRKSPLSFALPKLTSLSRRSRWERAPWFIRSSIEGLGIAVVILTIVAVVPRARTFYEKSLEKRLNAFNLAEFSLEGNGDRAPLLRGKLAPPDETAQNDDFEGDEALDENENEAEVVLTSAGETVRVGSSEIWRFTIKTDSPREVRPKVVKILTDLNLPPDTPGLGGIEAPGGIQFDVLVPQAHIADLKHHLQKIAGVTPGSEPVARGKEIFTWYKHKSRKHIPAGKARLVVWLSQM